MQERARIVEIRGDRVTVVPVDIEACIGCKNRECKANGSRFTAVNSRGLSLSPGDEVRVGASAKSQLAQGLVSVLLPALAAIAVYLLFPRLARGYGEGARVAATLAALAACAWTRVRVAGRFEPRHSEIVEVL